MIQFLEMSTDEAVQHIWECRDSAIQAAKQARRSNAVPPKTLRLALELYDKGGIGAVVEKLNVSRSYAYKLIARARQELEP
jgi:hypothetical protein